MRLATLFHFQLLVLVDNVSLNKFAEMNKFGMHVESFVTDWSKM